MVSELIEGVASMGDRNAPDKETVPSPAAAHLAACAAEIAAQLTETEEEEVEGTRRTGGGENEKTVYVVTGLYVNPHRTSPTVLSSPTQESQAMMADALEYHGIRERLSLEDLMMMMTFICSCRNKIMVSSYPSNSMPIRDVNRAPVVSLEYHNTGQAAKEPHTILPEAIASVDILPQLAV
jgi:hypothetical protein